jgi:enamine deaminase RidA (YjgF/YER057c/UK114 family)
MKRTNFSSGSKWENIVGYSRAVRIGNVIEVTGTVASGDDGNVVGKGDAYTQTKYIYQKIESVLKAGGGEHE